MSIAIPTYAPGAITNYAELVVEIRDLMDDADYSQQAIDRALRKAEAEFNRTLRTPEMETRVVLSITSELTPLPNDFLELRYIFSEGSPDTPLKSMSPCWMLSAYSGVSGTPQAYTIEGGQLRIGPVGNATLEMVYYRPLSALSDAQVSNWLLAKHPDLYVAGVMYHLARRERDRDGMAQAAQEVGDAYREHPSRPTATVGAPLP
ncbi:phage adaptor protein [Sphingomonas sp. MMS24-JH45]